MNDLEFYLHACEKGTIEGVNPEIFHDIDASNKYYVNKGILIACQLDKPDVISYVFKEIRSGYKNCREEDTDEEREDFACRRMFNYVVELFRANLQDICHKSSVNVVKEFTHELRGIPNHNDFGNCLKAASSGGNLTLIKYLLSTSDSQSFLEQWKYLNNYLDTKKDATEVIKYFVETPEVAPYVKQLKLFESAYANNNQELVEYFIFDCNMPYSKKTKKTVASMTNGVCNVPHLFENRGKILLAEKLQEDLGSKATSKPKVKI